MSNKKDKMRGASKLSQAEENIGIEEKEFNKTFTPEKRVYKQQTYTMELENIQYLNTTLMELRGLSKRNFNKSELIRAGLHILSQKSPEEIKELLLSI